MLWIYNEKCMNPVTYLRGHRGRDRMVVVLTTTHQSVSITIKVVSSNPAHGEVYSIQHYVIKFVSDLRHVCGFLRVIRFPPPIKTRPPQYNWNIVERDVKHQKSKPDQVAMFIFSENLISTVVITVLLTRQFLSYVYSKSDTGSQ